MKYAVVRLLVALLFVIPAFVAESLVPRFARDLGPTAAACLSALTACVLGWAAYAAYVKVAERRPLTEFSRAGALKELAAGLALGAALFGTSIGILAAIGCTASTGCATCRGWSCRWRCRSARASSRRSCSAA